ncbi:MAG: dihydrofolate reductase family protein [Calditrichaceae bacterium]
MRVKCSVYIATSIDGFIAKRDGGIEWLDNPEYSGVELKGLDYDDFIATVDAIVMGRNSYEKVRTFGFWPYEKTPVVVLTRRQMDIPNELQGKMRVENRTPKQLVTMLGKEGYQHLYIDGGITIQGFLRAGLIDEITITRIPVLLGSGIPLFGELEKEIPTRLISASDSDNGFVQVRYEIVRSAHT